MATPRKTPRRTETPAATPRKFWNIRNVAGAVPVLELFGDIGLSSNAPWYDEDADTGAGTFQEFATALRAIGNVPELRVEISSSGGDVVTGKAIHDKLLEHPAHKTAVIYGICASAATYPALACDEIQIPSNSFFLIHECSGFCCGQADDMRAMADSLDVANDAIASLYASRTGKTADEMRDIMAADTWMTGEEAVALGLADVVIEPIKAEPAKQAAPSNLSVKAFNRMPNAARVWFDSLALENAIKNKSAMSTPASPSAPAAAAPAAAAPAPAPAAPGAAPAPAAPAAAAPATPVVTNQAPAAPAAPVAVIPPPVLDLASIQNAVAAGIQTALDPLQTKIAELENKLTHGVTNAALGGAAPVAGALPQNNVLAPAPIDYAKENPLSLVSRGIQNAFRNKGIKPAGELTPEELAAAKK